MVCVPDSILISSNNFISFVADDGYAAGKATGNWEQNTRSTRDNDVT